MTNPANGKTVFVAGGAKGIGLAIVNALAADGYDVSFSYRGSAMPGSRSDQRAPGSVPGAIIQQLSG